MPWEGVLPGVAAVPAHVEAAALSGRPSGIRLPNGRRVGLLAVFASMLPTGLYLGVPALGGDPSAWYAPASYLPLASLVALSGYAFRLALGPRKVWGENAFDL